MGPRCEHCVSVEPGRATVGTDVNCSTASGSPTGILTCRNSVRHILPSPAIAGIFMTSSPEAGRNVTPGRAAKGFYVVYRLTPCFLLCMIWFFIRLTPAVAQRAPQSPVPSSSQQPETKETSAEIASHDEPTTFKVNVKLVVVRAVF